jgi:PadR family transcriptional regulator PadR
MATKQKTDVLQGTLALMVLKTLDVLGTLHGYGIARRIEQISGDILSVNQGTLYPVLLKLEQEGAIVSEWGASENNRRARFYKLTREGRKQLQVETQDWQQTTAIIGRFFEANAEDLSWNPLGGFSHGCPASQQGAPRTSDCAKRLMSISLCKPPKIFAQVCHPLKRDAKQC